MTGDGTRQAENPGDVLVGAEGRGAPAGCHGSACRVLWLRLVARVGGDGSSRGLGGGVESGQEGGRSGRSEGTVRGLSGMTGGWGGGSESAAEKRLACEGRGRDLVGAGREREAARGGEVEYGLVALSDIPKEWLGRFVQVGRMFCEVQQAVIASNVQLWCAACSRSHAGEADYRGGEGAGAGGAAEDDVCGGGDQAGQRWRGGGVPGFMGMPAHRKVCQDYAQQLCRLLWRLGAETCEQGSSVVLRDQDRLLLQGGRCEEAGGGEGGAGRGILPPRSSDSRQGDHQDKKRKAHTREGWAGDGGEADALRGMGLPLSFGCSRRGLS